MRNKLIFIIATLVVLTIIVIAIQNLEQKVVQLETKVSAMEANITELYAKSEEIEVYNSKVDSMVFSYETLDRILEKMFGASQADYLRRLRK